MAVAVSGWGTLSFVHPCQHLWAIAQEGWRTKRCLGCTSGYCFSGLAPSPDSLCGLWQATQGWFQARMWTLLSWQSPIPMPDPLPPSQCSPCLIVEKSMPPALLWACHETSQFCVAQCLIHAWLVGNLQMMYYFVCGPLRGSFCLMISERTSQLFSKHSHWKSSATVSTASHDGETSVWFPVLTKSLWTCLSHLPSKHGEGVEEEVLSLSLLWKLFHFASNNYRFIRERWRDREKARLNTTLLVRFSHLEEEEADLDCSRCSNDYLTFYPMAV